MEQRPLTTWEQKERDGLLALETDEWRQKRRIAEDPSTTADVLKLLANDLQQVYRYHRWNGERNRADEQARNAGFSSHQSRASVLLGEALVAHPNTPPETILDLLQLDRPFSDVPRLMALGFCRNPIAEFIILEVPDFWVRLGRLSSEWCFPFLCNPMLPPQAARCFASYAKRRVVPIARLHIAFAGEIQTQEEGRRAVTQFWQAFCKERMRTTLSAPLKQQHAELVQWRVAPCWAASAEAIAASAKQGRYSSFFLSPRLRGLVFQWAAQRYKASNSEFVRFVAYLRGTPAKPCDLISKGVSIEWMDRLTAALCLLPSDDSQPCAEYGRSTRDLLHHLAHDGNRLVRWAAQTRLADPDFVFTWHEENGER